MIATAPRVVIAVAVLVISGCRTPRPAWGEDYGPCIGSVVRAHGSAQTVACADGTRRTF